MASALTVLIVDDCPEDRQAYRRYLQQDSEYQYTILEEESGAGGLELCQQLQPDGILLDFLLPDLDGLEFLEELKQQAKGVMPAVIMLTGYGSEAVAVQAMKSGVQDYLVKGQTTPELLRSTIHSAIKNAQLTQELRRSEERFYTSVENMLDCFGIYSAIRNEAGEITDFCIDYLNAAACKFNQKQKEEQLGKGLCEILLIKRDSDLFQELCQVVETGEPLIKESLVYTSLAGQQQLSKAFDIRITKMADGFVAAWRDVTPHKLAEIALRQSEERYRYLSNAIPQLVWMCDATGECEYVNQKWYEFTEQPVEQAMGFGWTEVIHPDEVQLVMQVWMEALQIGETYEQEMRYRSHDGTYRWYLVRSVPIKDEQGNLVKWFGTSTDIHDRKQLEAERNQLLQLEKIARAEAEAANRSKDEFVAMVSHDLRSPLHAILGWTKLLRTRQMDTASINNALETIERSAHSQAALLEDLLNISRIIQGKLQLDCSQVDLAAIVGVAIEAAYPLAHGKNIHLNATVDRSIPTIRGDWNRLLQVLGNLLANAIKFTPSGGSVEVKLWQDGTNAKIAVTDTGIGISPEFLPQVFERYHQGDRTHQKCGLGLGLAIARHLIQLHGGTIQVASPGIGLGATFTIALPL
jgi:PAS domain S-box-containing protein